MNRLTFLKIACILFVFCAVTAIVAPAQTLTTLHNFAGYPSDGANPYAGLIQARDGNFYGTTTVGGANGGCAFGSCGTVFKITPSGTLTTLHSFNGSDGETPEGGLVQATDGRFYGTTFYGGTGLQGTVFKIAANGTLTVLYNFGNNTNDAALPYDGLIQATDGNFYGTTSRGGTGFAPVGAVFKITPQRHPDHAIRLRHHRRCRPRRRTGASQRRKLLRDNLSRRWQLRGLRYGVQNHSQRHADYAALLSRCRRQQSPSRAGTGNGRQVLRHHRRRRGEQSRYSLQNLPQRNPDHALQFLSCKWMR